MTVSLIFHIFVKHLYTPLLIAQCYNVQHVLHSIPSHEQSLWQFWSTIKKNVFLKKYFISLFYFCHFFFISVFAFNSFNGRFGPQLIFLVILSLFFNFAFIFNFGFCFYFHFFIFPFFVFIYFFHFHLLNFSLWQLCPHTSVNIFIIKIPYFNL